MVWNFRSDLPIYSQLIEQIKLGIVSGSFLPGERLASVRDIPHRPGLSGSQATTMARCCESVRQVKGCADISPITPEFLV